jgi:oligopeptidase A
VADYVTQAIGGHDLLRDEIRTATDSPDDPMNHFAHYVRQITAGSALPLIPVRACVDLGRAVIEDVFGLEVTSLDPAATTVIRLSLTRHGKATGAIHVEMKSAGPAPSLPVARPLSSGGIAAGPELPVGRCLARYQLDEHGVQVMNLEAAHSLLHEFGHAVNHVLLAERRPGVTGLDYLPVERLEDLSAWFEKWAFHDELLRYTDFSAEQTRGLLVSRQVKMLEFLSTHLRRAVVGALDLQVHSEPVGIQEAFQRLIGQHDIEGYCALGDVLEYFVRPLFRAHPGCAGLTYLWSYAFGAERFEPFCAVTLQTAGARLSDDLLRSCFVPSEVSVRPDVSAVRRFYEGHVPLALIIRA